MNGAEACPVTVGVISVLCVQSVNCDTDNYLDPSRLVLS
jgi:hypothetical protein